MAAEFAFDYRGSEYCSFCRGISFHTLPHEEDPGFPHQPSFASLKLSVRSCPLCYLLLRGINETRPGVRDGGGFRLFTSHEKESTRIQVEVILGAYAGPSGGGLVTDPPFQPLDELRKLIDDDNVLKPWLYENQYVSAENEKLLISIGVRLGKSAEITAVKGNTKESVVLRGSQLRLRTSDGKLRLHLIVIFLGLLFR